MVILLSLVCIDPACAARNEGPKPSEPQPSLSYSLSRTLSQKVTISWQEVPLREALTRIGKTFGLAWFLDRRVDPNRLVTLSANHLSLATMIDTLAEQNGLSIKLFDDLIYFGPAEESPELLEPRQGVGRSDSLKNGSLPTTRLRKSLARRDRSDWPHLTEPRRLIEQLLSESRIKAEGTDLVPHDLWTSHSLPTLSLKDRLSLLLIGFELDWQVEPTGRSLEIVPRKNESNTPIKRFQLAALIDKPNRSKRLTTQRESEQRYTLRIESQPLRLVLLQIATSAQRELTIREEAKEHVERRVSIAVEQVTLEELLRKLTAAAECIAKVEEKRILIELGEE